MIHIWNCDGYYARYDRRRLRMNVTESVYAYIDELCRDKIDRFGAAHFPYTQEIWSKLLSFGVEVVER